MNTPISLLIPLKAGSLELVSSLSLEESSEWFSHSEKSVQLKKLTPIEELPAIFAECSSIPLEKEDLLAVQACEELVLVETQLSSFKEVSVFFKELLSHLPDSCPGIYLQSSGATHTRKQLESLIDEGSTEANFELCIQFFWSGDFLLTQGMDTLGWPDVGLSGEDPDALREELMVVLANVAEGEGELAEGVRFEMPSEVIYRLKSQEDWGIPAGEPGHNELGTLRLVKSLK